MKCRGNSSNNAAMKIAAHSVYGSCSGKPAGYYGMTEFFGEAVRGDARDHFLELYKGLFGVSDGHIVAQGKLGNYLKGLLFVVYTQDPLVVAVCSSNTSSKLCLRLDYPIGKLFVTQKFWSNLHFVLWHRTGIIIQFKDLEIGITSNDPSREQMGKGDLPDMDLQTAIRSYKIKNIID